MSVRLVRNAAEIERLSKALKRGDVQSFSFPFTGANPASLTNAAYASYQALYSFAVVGISMSAVYFNPTTTNDSVLLLTRDSAHAHYPSGNFLAGVELARLVFTTQNAKSIQLGGGIGGVDGLERHCYFVEKGQTLYAHLHSASVAGSIACDISVNALIIGDQ